MARHPRTGHTGHRAAVEGLECRVLLSVSLVKSLGATPLGTFDNDTSPLVPFGGEVYFEPGNSLWKSDGTGAGTVPVKDLSPLTPSTPVEVGSALLFGVSDGNGNWQLWKSDGTSGGTTLVTVLPTTDAADDYTAFVAAGSNLYFLQHHGQAIGQPSLTLWTSDGTAAGTRAVVDLPGPTVSSLIRVAAVNGKLVFTASDATHW